MNGWMIRTFAAASIVVLAAPACSKSNPVSAGGGGGPSSGSGESTLTVDGKSLNNHGTKDVSSGGGVVIQMNDYFFTPTVITGLPRQKVRIELKNASGTTHNFSLSEPGLKLSQDVSSGGDQSVTVNIPQSGAAVFFCKFHQGSGMRGALNVAGSGAVSAGSTSGSGGQSSSSGRTGGGY